MPCLLAPPGGLRLMFDSAWISPPATESRAGTAASAGGISGDAADGIGTDGGVRGIGDPAGVRCRGGPAAGGEDDRPPGDRAPRLRHARPYQDRGDRRAAAWARALHAERRDPGTARG